MNTLTIDAPALADVQPIRAAICTCGGTLYSGRCFNLGACEQADKRASSHNAPGSEPRAWTIAGRVD